ncbi:MAG: ComF family protein [Clostridia bacterium]|nr:ComF family protein [Clostridia bacterium]
MSFKSKLKNIFNSVEDLLFSNHSCVSCGREIPDGSQFSMCLNCFNELRKIDGKLCKKCGAHIEGNADVCDECKETSFEFNCNRSCFYYDEVPAKIIKNLKYSGNKFIAKIVAEMMMTRPEFFDGIDIITFVPLSKKKLRERGFNQSEEIAKIIGAKTGIKVHSLLLKVSDGKNQASLSGKERLENLKDAFEPLVEAKSIVKNKRVLILDDIFTTGTTLNECAKALAKLKPKQISTVTFLKTDFGKND